ncbi:MAG TPA: pseudouridine synthase [Phycisphaerales bacterium]|nr:pseudouridine synthase [Phycisphaerales bacterium]
MRDKSHHQNGTADGRVRLHKRLAELGVASRRTCEELIASGRVRVNGEVARRSPVLVDVDRDRVEIDGEVVHLKSKERHVYVMLYKPRHTVTTLSDPDGRRTVTELVRHPSGARLFPVGRLDYDTMGLLLLTNDGELANKLTHPRHGVHKTYRAIVKNSLTPADVTELEKGIYLVERKQGRSEGASRTSPVKLEIVSREPTRTVLDITLQEGRNRQVRRMFANVNCPVKKLVRISMGPLRLKGVKLGEWRELTTTELRLLRAAADGRPVEGTAGSSPIKRRERHHKIDERGGVGLIARGSRVRREGPPRRQKRNSSPAEKGRGGERRDRKKFDGRRPSTREGDRSRADFGGRPAGARDRGPRDARRDGRGEQRGRSDGRGPRAPRGGRDRGGRR